MEGYRRFVAYVYEYRQGKKEANCGFVKIEMRNGRCVVDLHLKCPGLTSGTECKIYGFVREKENLKGILLGSCQTGENGAVCHLETDGKNMGGRGVSLEQLGGMTFVTELGAFFGTEWDDERIRPENFRESEENRAEMLEEEAQKSQEEEAAEPEPSEPKTAEPEVQAEEVCKEQVIPPCKGRAVWQPREAEEMGEGFVPFADEEFSVCRKIHPQDLMRLSRKECVLRSNRFLTYGYSHFGHLLLAQRRDGRFVLGVPGVYEQQEHFMAKMFGFPCFKESGFIELPEGQGGYWYRLIDSPDFH